MKRNYIEDVISHSGKGVHPRIILTAEDFERIRTTDDLVYNEAKRIVMAEAESYMNKPVLEYDIPDGIRLLQVCRYMLARVMYLGMAYRLTLDKRYAERLYRDLAHAAEFKDWNPYHFLDVGEMSCAFGIGYDWLYDYMNEDQRKVLRDAIKKNSFEAAMDDYLDRERKRSYRWYQDNPGDNWKMVCNGGITVAGLAICDEEDVDKEWLTQIFDFAFENTYRAVRDMYLPDGSYSEGFTYWNYASDYLGYYVSALKSATGTDYGLADYDPVRKSAYYSHLMCSNSSMSFNFGDAWEVLICPEVLFWIGKNFNEKGITSLRVAEIERDPSLARVCDLFWYIPTEKVGLTNIPCGFGTVGGDNAAFRAGLDRDDFYAAIHFGDNNAYHGHSDMGTFVAEWKCRRFFADLGQDNYNVKGNYRFTYRYRAEGHNTLVINPGEGHDQQICSVCRADVFCDGENGEAYVVSNISDAYFGKSVKRGMRMTEDRRWVVIRDELAIDNSDTGYWFAHTSADITLVDDGRSAVLEMDGERMYATVLEGGKFEVMPAVHLYEGHYMPDQYDNSKYKKLAIRFNGATNISVAIAPMPDGVIPEDLPENKSLSELV